MSLFRGVAAGLGACALGGLLGGLAAAPAAADDNGIADESATTIAEKAREAMADAQSMTLDARITDATGTTTLDLHLDVDGNCAGTVGLPGNGGHADLIKRGQDVWMKLDDTLLKSQVPGPAGDAAIALINGRYIHGTVQNALLRDFTDFCDLSNFKNTFAGRPVNEQLTKGQRTTVDGAPAITVTSRHDNQTGTYYVSTEDTPYLLKAEVREPGKRDVASFGDFNEPVPAKTPAPADTIEFSDLQ
ncbi:hypothetical protein ACIQUQ_04250 [Streptomyces sp. NPDC101118]|uniref:hypothetical protein n=1 Tax=Streptomyces sp. NPDC101118 TaxID=3366109 RepID=UPI00382A5554